MVCQHLSTNVPEDFAFADSRTHTDRDPLGEPYFNNNFKKMHCVDNSF